MNQSIRVRSTEKCSIDDCDCTVWGRGLCKAHWRLAWQDDLIEQFPKAADRPTVIGAGRVFLYVMRSDLGLLKVGYSQAPELREVGVRLEAGVERVETLFVCPAGNAREAERVSHFLLRASRANGEWFACSTEDAISAVLQAASGHRPPGMGNWRLPRKRRKFVVAWEAAAPKPKPESLAQLKREFCEYWATYDEVWVEPTASAA